MVVTLLLAVSFCWVLSEYDMDVDVDVYDADDIDECYKVESQVC